MRKKHIITIGGKPGSGKSTTSKRIAVALGYDRFSSGDLFRTIAKERGADIYQGNILAEEDHSIDEAVDTKLREIGEQEDRVVIDSRMAWYWMPYSFKVYLDLDLKIAAQRILSGMDAERIEVEHVPDTPEAYAKQLQLRLDSESKRYLSLYDQNPYDTSNYDLIVDTAIHDLGAVQSIILEKYRTWLLE